MNIQSVSWITNSQSMPFAIQHARSITINNDVLVIGGYDRSRDNGRYLNTIYAIDGTKGSVSLVGHLAKTVVYFALIVADNVLYSFGGIDMDSWEEEEWSQWQTKSIEMPTIAPSTPTSQPLDTKDPTKQPSVAPSDIPTMNPSQNATNQPTFVPVNDNPLTMAPSRIPFQNPTEYPIGKATEKTNQIPTLYVTEDSDRQMSTTATTTDTSNTNHNQNHMSIVYVASGAVVLILMLTVATVLFLKSRKAQQINKQIAPEISDNKDSNKPDIKSECVVTQVGETNGNVEACGTVLDENEGRCIEMADDALAVSGENQEDEGQYEATNRGSVMHISDDVVPTGGNYVNEEQKEDVILDAMLSDILEMQNLDPNKIHQINLNNSVNQVNNNSDSDESDRIYQH
eukprot:588911_1